MIDAALHLSPYCVNIEMVLSSTLTEIYHIILNNTITIKSIKIYANVKTQRVSLVQSFLFFKRVSIVRNLRILSPELL